MKVSLTQRQIELAILMYINATGMPAQPEGTTFSFTATRKKKDGLDGEVLCDVEVADPKLTFTSDTPEVKVNTTDGIPGTDIDNADLATTEEILAEETQDSSESNEANEPSESEESADSVEESSEGNTSSSNPFADLKSAEELNEESADTENNEQAKAASLFSR